MKTLYINVSNKVATYRQRDGVIVCGNSDYQIKFAFDSEWDSYTKKTARFIWGGHYLDVNFTGDVCRVPVLRNTNEVRVGVYAGDLSTTTPAVIECKQSILCGDNDPLPEEEADREYASEAKASADRAEVAATRAETAADRAEAAGGSGGGVTIVQTTGSSTSAVMSQKAVTDALANVSGGGGGGTGGKGVDSIEARPPEVYVPFTDSSGNVLNPAYPIYDYEDSILLPYKPGLLEWFGGESFTGVCAGTSTAEVEISVRRGASGISIAVDGADKGTYVGGYDVVYGKESAAGVSYLEIIDAYGNRISPDIYLGYPRMYSKADLPAGYVTKNYLYKINFSDGTFQYIVIKDGFSPNITVERGAPVATLATSTVTAFFDLPEGTTQVHIEGTSTGVASGGVGVLFKQYRTEGGEISSATMVSGSDAETSPVDVTYDISELASRIGIVSGNDSDKFTCDLRITFIGAEATNITVTDASGTKTAPIFDGTDGKDGKSIGYISLMQTSTDSEGRVQRDYDVFYTDNSTVGSFTVTDGKDGKDGDPYKLTETDKAAIATAVKNSFATETWTFELEDGSTVTKKVVLG